MKTKKIPMRMCCGCGEMKPKKELIRVVKTPDGSISLDFTGKKSGRGAYLCKSTECFKSAKKSRKLTYKNYQSKNGLKKQAFNSKRLFEVNV